MLEVNFDAFSDGQMASKIWLCEELERRWSREQPLTVWVFGSWYGLTALALIIRGRLPIQEIHLFDIEESAQEVAKKVLKRRNFQEPRVYFHTTDFLELSGQEDLFQSKTPGLVINTSCEKFPTTSWIHAIPAGSWVALQSTNQGRPFSLQEFCREWENDINILSAQKLKVESLQSSFDRFLILGKVPERN